MRNGRRERHDPKRQQLRKHKNEDRPGEGREGPALQAPLRWQFSRRTYRTERPQPAVPSFFAAKRANTTACTTWDRAVASAAPRTPRPNSRRRRSLQGYWCSRTPRARSTAPPSPWRRAAPPSARCPATKGRAEGPYPNVRRRALLHLDGAPDAFPPIKTARNGPAMSRSQMRASTTFNHTRPIAAQASPMEARWRRAARVVNLFPFLEPFRLRRRKFVVAIFGTAAR